MEGIKRGLFPGQGAGLTNEQAQEMYGKAVKRRSYNFAVTIGNNDFTASLPGLASVILGVFVTGVTDNVISIDLNNLKVIENVPSDDMTRIEAQPDFVPLGLPVNGNDTLSIEVNQAATSGSYRVTFIYI